MSETTQEQPAVADPIPDPAPPAVDPAPEPEAAKPEDAPAAEAMPVDTVLQAITDGFASVREHISAEFAKLHRRL